MEVVDSLQSRVRQSGLLYPLLVIAALTVTVFSIVGIATMLGWLPRAMSGTEVSGASAPVVADTRDSEPAPGAYSEPRTPYRNEPSVNRRMNEPRAPAHAPRASAPAGSVPAVPAHNCAECGVVESVKTIEMPGESSWLGTAGGAVVGGLLGHQIGSGSGRTVATVAGAAGGAYAGNQIEKHVNKTVRYRVRVRMADGSARTFTRQTPAFAVGQKVRVTDHGIVAAE